MKESLRQQDYHKVFQKRGDCIRLLAQTSGVVIFFAWFFYRSIWAVPLLFPLGILYFRRCVNRQCRKNRQELTMQFKECILSVANSLRSGYALENAFLESREDIRMLYGEHSAMYRELELIRRGMILNITLEELISDLADRSGIEEIEQFSAILNIAKRGGGNVTQIIRTTAEVISNKVETMASYARYLFRELEFNIDDPAFATFDFQGYGERQLGLLESVQTTYGMITRNEDFPIQTQQNTEQGMKMQ